MKKNILITGGCGFIGANLLLKLVPKYSSYNFINIDNLTPAANYKRLNPINNKNNYVFVKIDINSYQEIEETFKKYNINNVIHLAAESHVDNAIITPLLCAKTNVLGTINLLDIAYKTWHNNFDDKLFIHISTDEVFGSIDNENMNQKFTENSPYSPNSIYSSSKAASDHFVRAYANTFNLPYIIINCSNNYGPGQHYEKLVAKTIYNLIKKSDIPIYGNGKNIRDWIFIDDHIEAIDKLLHSGFKNESFNIGGNLEITNIELVKLICALFAKITNTKEEEYTKSIIFTMNRKAHDYKYAIDFTKINQKLNWKPTTKLKDGLTKTINWYIEEYGNR